MARALLVSAALLLSACSTAGVTSREAAELVTVGQSRAEIVAKMGQPGARSFRGDVEALQYCRTGMMTDLYWTIWLRAGLVIGVNASQDATSPGVCNGHFPPVDWASAPGE